MRCIICNSLLYKTNRYKRATYGCPICFNLYSLSELKKKHNFKFWTNNNDDDQGAE